jgi:hypothetical protein
MNRVLILTFVAIACGKDPPSNDTPTYYGEVAAIFEAKCLQCHREGGIAPFRLDRYDEAHPRAALIRASVVAGSMPPWSIVSDGSCGEFAHSIALEDSQIDVIEAWVDGGAPAGNPREVAVPELPALEGATDLATPLFTPEIVGGALAEFDEYRCFEIDPGIDGPMFITGYDVVPGTPEIVHHLIVVVVDPSAPSDADPGITNAEQMATLDAESADRDGWPCFGGAGEGVSVAGMPVTWAPGQGIVEYPNSSGVAIAPGQKLVAQVHYNLADAANIGKSDRTVIRLRYAEQVENLAFFVLEDPLLDSLFDDEPVTLPPRLASALYSWNTTVGEIGGEGLSGLELWGIMPHMHELGHRFDMHLTRDGERRCVASIEEWDFHWQRMYFYEQPLALDASSSIEVTCDYDTRSVDEPVLPGWGTRNEMCLANMFLTVPIR